MISRKRAGPSIPDTSADARSRRAGPNDQLSSTPASQHVAPRETVMAGVSSVAPGSASSLLPQQHPQYPHPIDLWNTVAARGEQIGARAARLLKRVSQDGE